MLVEYGIIEADKIGANVEAITLAVNSIGKLNFERLLKLHTRKIKSLLKLVP